jgi:hypothetical protein
MYETNNILYREDFFPPGSHGVLIEIGEEMFTNDRVCRVLWVGQSQIKPCLMSNLKKINT